MTTGIFTPKECECPIEHSIVKLGHCQDCPHHGTESDPPVTFPVARIGGCGVTAHVDGTPHDFDYATYADERERHGVCRCGLTCETEMLWEGP